MGHTIFISSNLTKDSLFFSSFGKEVIVRYGSLIEFHSIPFSGFPKSDFIFFYSKNAVRFFLEQVESKNLLKMIPMCCMGEGTADFLRTYGYEPFFIGNGNPEETAFSFLEFSKGKKVLFPRAINSKKSIQLLLKDKIEVLDLVVYRNEKKNNIENPLADILIFTSPMNVETYFDNLDYNDEKIISIGNTTAKKIIELGFNDFVISEKPTEEALIEEVIKMINVE